MTEPQGQPDHETAAAPEPVQPAEPGPPSEPPAAAQSPEPSPQGPPAKKAPAKKAPAKKAPAKKAAAKKAPAKAAKKAPAKKAPAKAAPPKAPTGAAIPIPPAVGANGSGQLAERAKEAAAQAKSTVDAVRNPLSPSAAPAQRSPGPVLAAGVLGLFGLLLLRRLFRARRG